MYEYLEGRLADKSPAQAVIDCGGVGYLLNISINTYSAIASQEHCKLYTYLAVREDAMTLYGFAEKDERVMFLQLLSVSGVGANTARLILSSMTPAEVRHAIIGGNVAALKSIKGIGAKSAQRIIVDLKDKVGVSDETINKIVVADNTIKTEALSALSTLGFDKNRADKAVDKILQEQGDELSVEEVIKAALKLM